MIENFMRLFVILFLIILAGCNQAEQPPQEVHLVLSPVDFSALPDWKQDDLQTFVPAFTRSCQRIMKDLTNKPFSNLEQAGTYKDWQSVCQKFLGIKTPDTYTLKNFFEANFTPYEVRDTDNPIGLFTGYYEASLKGSRERKEPYTIPLHTRPDDLVMVDLGLFREELKGQRIAGRVQSGNLLPYEARADIVAGNWSHADKVLVWVDDAVDAFFVQIQGSGIVSLDNGSTMRIGYAGQNGHSYYAIGKELIARGALTKETVSMQTIRAWLEEHPQQADEVMNTNKSYVFFQEITGEAPIGGEGVALTAQRSLAIDHSLLPYGVPLWVDIEKPSGEEQPIRKLMVAQDTGGAIRGAVRGDVFWGYGEHAEQIAGQMKSKGRYWILLPKL